MTTIKFKKINDFAEIPTKVYESDAGFDFKCINDFILDPNEMIVVDTGLSCALEDGYELQIRPKSGLAMKGITIVNSPGTIDCHYRGPIKIILANIGTQFLDFKKGYKIAQGVIQQLPSIKIIEVSELDKTDRNEKGFGSSGK